VAVLWVTGRHILNCEISNLVQRLLFQHSEKWNSALAMSVRFADVFTSGIVFLTVNLSDAYFLATFI